MEKQECVKDHEQNKLCLSDEKCKKCENIYKCKFYAVAMDDILNGDDY